VRRRFIATVVVVLMVGGCTDNDKPASSSSSTTEPGIPLPSALEVESEDLTYGIAGTNALNPIGENRVMTLGMVIQNRSSADVRIEEVEVAEAEGLAVTPTLVIRTPRAITQIHGEAGFPPKRVWEPSAEMQFAPFDLPPGADSADWGALVLMEVTVSESAPFAYAKGVWVRGTQDGRSFEDFVDAFNGYCTDGNQEPTQTCYEFANQHAFAPFEALSE